jgi:filamentous hemagglutinin
VLFEVPRNSDRLETGNSKAGLQHIMNAHGEDFANIDVPAVKIPEVIMQAVTQGKLVSYQGAGTGRPIYEVTMNGQTLRIAVTTGNNGFIVGANPVGGVK